MNLVKALVHELASTLLFVVIFGVLIGTIMLIVHAAGDYSIAIFLLLVYLVLQAKIVWDKAQYLKRRNGK